MPPVVPQLFNDLDFRSYKGLNAADPTTPQGVDTKAARDAAIAAAVALKADLVGGKVPTGQLPDLAITNTFVVADQAAMLALSVQVGDVAVRSDTSSTYILATSPATVLGNWVQLATPTDQVISVNGYQGVVALTYGDVGAAAAAHGHAIGDITGLVTALAAKADVSALAAYLQLAGGVLTGVTVSQPGALVYSGSTFTPVAQGAGSKNIWRGTLTQATTVANPSGTPADGTVLRLELTQDGTGGYAVTWGSKYLGSDDLALAQPAAGASKRTVWNFEYDLAADKWLQLGKNAGYQL